jgi:hypothetical protein
VHITSDRAAEEEVLTNAKNIANERLSGRPDLGAIFMDALTSIAPTIFHHDERSGAEPGTLDGVFTKKSGHITLNWTRAFERASVSTLNLVSDDAQALAGAALALCAYHADQALAVGDEEAAVVCALWSYRNADGRIDTEAAFSVAAQNFLLRQLGGLQRARFDAILGALVKLRIIGAAGGVLTMLDKVELSYP